MPDGTTTDCKPTHVKAVECEIYIRRFTEPGIFGFFAIIWNWREAWMSVNKYQSIAMWKRFKLYLTSEPAYYEGSAVGAWQPATSGPPRKDDTTYSSVDVSINIPEPGMLAVYKVVFTFKSETEFTFYSNVKWDPIRRQEMSVVEVPCPIRVDERHEITLLSFYFTDNRDAKATPSSRMAGGIHETN
jgi:hypothetical protein